MKKLSSLCINLVRCDFFVFGMQGVRQISVDTIHFEFLLYSSLNRTTTVPGRPFVRTWTGRFRNGAV